MGEAERPQQVRRLGRPGSGQGGDIGIDGKEAFVEGLDKVGPRPLQEDLG
jgi:hypothetical protein